METTLTIVSFVFFTGLVAFITWLLTRKDDHGTAKGYFLGGRTLTATFIAGSLLLTNLSTEQMVGLNGTAFNDGFSCMVWEVVAVIGLVLMAVYFLPRFLKSGIATVPQFLELRFGHSTQVICNIIFMIAYTVILLPIILYSGAKGFDNMLDIRTLTGIESEMGRIYLIVIIVGTIGSFYALFGGLRTVAVSDTLNGAGLLIGGMLIPIFGLAYLSNEMGNGNGLMEGFSMIKDAYAQNKEGFNAFNSIGSKEQGVPFFTIFSGVLLLNLFYWCTNQQIIQRTFGASSLKEGQKGVLLTGALKLLGPLYLVIPGMIAYAIFVKTNPTLGDKAYGMLVKTVLPWPLRGFFAAVMVGAVLSSFNSALNSTTTLFSLGTYKNFFNKNASDEETVKSGKIFGWVIAIIVITTAPLLLFTDGAGGGIFKYLQMMNAIYMIPIFSVIVVGMLTKKVPAIPANISLIAGIALIGIGYFIPMGTSDAGKMLCFLDVSGLNNFHFVGIVFFLLVAFMLIYSQIAPKKDVWIQKHSGDVDMTPWKFAKPAATVLIIIVLSIYVIFADFSVLKGINPWKLLIPVPAILLVGLIFMKGMKILSEKKETE